MPRLRGRPRQPTGRPARQLTLNCMAVIADLTALQDEHGFTDARLGQLAGYSDQMLFQWRMGSAAPRLATLADFAEVFGHEVRLVPKRDGRPDPTRHLPIYIPKFLPRR